MFFPVLYCKRQREASVIREEGERAKFRRSEDVTFGWEKEKWSQAGTHTHIVIAGETDCIESSSLRWKGRRSAGGRRREEQPADG